MGKSRKGKSRKSKSRKRKSGSQFLAYILIGSLGIAAVLALSKMWKGNDEIGMGLGKATKLLRDIPLPRLQSIGWRTARENPGAVHETVETIRRKVPPLNLRAIDALREEALDYHDMAGSPMNTSRTASSMYSRDWTTPAMPVYTTLPSSRSSGTENEQWPTFFDPLPSSRSSGTENEQWPTFFDPLPSSRSSGTENEQWPTFFDTPRSYHSLEQKRESRSKRESRKSRSKRKSRKSRSKRRVRR
jgi:hypothetical protein